MDIPTDFISSDTIPYDICQALRGHLGLKVTGFIGFNDESEYVFTATNEVGEWTVYVDHDPIYDCADVRYTFNGAGVPVTHLTDMFL